MRVRAAPPHPGIYRVPPPGLVPKIKLQGNETYTVWSFKRVEITVTELEKTRLFHSDVFANVALVVAHKFPTITENKRKKKLTFKVFDALWRTSAMQELQGISGFKGGFPLSLVLMSAVFPGYLYICIETDLKKNKHMIVNTNKTACDDSATSWRHYQGIGNK